MSIVGSGNWKSLCCDFCDEATEEFREFDDMISSSKSLGWKIYQERGEWMHKCPGCADNRKPGESDLQRARRLLG